MSSEWRNETNFDVRHFTTTAPALTVVLPLIIGTSLILFGRLIKTGIRLMVNRNEQINYMAEFKTLYMERPPQIKHYTKYSSFSVRTYMFGSTFGSWWLILQMLLTLLSISFYVSESYYRQAEKETWMIISEIVIAMLFTIDYLISLYGSEDKLRFFWSINSVVDLLTVVPVYIELFTIHISDDSVLKVLRAARVFRLVRLLQFTVSVVQRQFMTLIITFFSLFYFATTIVQQLEGLQFHDALYLITVTFTTVGYGDLHPDTAEGKIVMIVLILISFFVLSYQTGQLVSTINDQSPYAASYEPIQHTTRKHVVLMGDVSNIALVEFFREFFQSSHRSHYTIVILAAEDPTRELQQILKVPFFKQNVNFYTKSDNIQSDMERIKISRAAACFIMSTSYDPKLTETDLIMQAIAVKARNPDLPLYMQIPRPDQNLDFLTGVQLIAWEEIVMAIFGQNSVTEGFATLVMNLIRTTEVPNSVRKSAFKDRWLREYVNGAANQIYKGKLPNFFLGKTFQEAATFAYARFGVTLFGLEVVVEGKNDKITLINPPDHIIRFGDEGFMIANGPEAADKVTRYQRSTDPEAGQNTSDKLFLVPGLKQLVTYSSIMRDYLMDDVLQDEVFPLEVLDVRPSYDRPSYQHQFGLISTNWRDLYHISDKTFNLEEQTKKFVKFTGHIVLSGCPTGLFYFVLPLRSKKLNHMQKIVILHTEPPSEEEWKLISIFPDVYFIEGTIETHIKESCIPNASRLIIFSDPKLRNGSMIPDAHTVIAIRTLEKKYPKLKVNAELLQASSGRLLTGAEVHPSFKPKFRWYQGWDPTLILSDDDGVLNLCAGHIVSPSLIYNALLAQSFYQPFLVHLVQLFVLGAKLGVDASSSVFRIAVPPELIDRNYGSLFHSFVNESKVMPIAIYRHREGSKPYVYTNPPVETILFEKDEIFVFATHQPKLNITVTEDDNLLE